MDNRSALMKKEGIDGWLLYDFRGSNQLAIKELKLSPDAHLTRRLVYWIPSNGQPVKLVHAIEEGTLDHLEGQKRLYRSRQEFEEGLKSLLTGSKRVAMEISPMGHIPYLSLVDAGTVDLIRSFGVEVVSSSRLVQEVSILTPEQLDSQRRAAHIAEKAVEEGWQFVIDSLKKGVSITEYDLQQFLVTLFQKKGQMIGFPPIVAVNAHSADPHYHPTEKVHAPIKRGDLLLIDLGCKESEGIYSDITKMALIDRPPTPLEEEVFSLVRKAQKGATDLITTHWEGEKPLLGCQVDELARSIISDAGYGDYFLHRLGHSVTDTLHGTGAHLDSFETLDDRPLLLNTCTTIEPGLYLPNRFGIRLEYDLLLLSPPSWEITGGIQETFNILKL